jgi:hypothetical protein
MAWYLLEPRGELRDDLRVGHFAVGVINTIRSAMGAQKMVQLPEMTLSEVLEASASERRPMTDEESLIYAKSIALATGGELIDESGND